MLFLGCSPSIHSVAVSQNKAVELQKSLPSPAENQAETIVNTKNEPVKVDPIILPDHVPEEKAPLDMETTQGSGADQSKTTDTNRLKANKTVSRYQVAQSALDEALDFCRASQDFWQKGELENAIEALDHAYSLILGIDADDMPKIIQQKEDIRFLISKRILEISASRHIVVNGNYNAIPRVMNKHVQAEINLFSTGRENKFFIESYKRSGKFRPYIAEALKKAGLPVELSWLPLIESGFKVNAFSKARALGLWQFIASTGYKFGLKRDTYIDERLDPLKSTAAAVAYLQELHQIFGDWATVLAAYNCGEFRVLRVIRNQNINYLDNFWDLYERLPRETARFVPRFLATLHLVNNPKKYGLDKIQTDTPLEFETVNISIPAHLKTVAKAIGLPTIVLRELNPELRFQFLPGDNYPLRVPSEKAGELIARLVEIPASIPPSRRFVYHKIKPGETLSTISRHYRVSMHRIAIANNITKHHYIIAGKTLKIPQKSIILSRSKIDTTLTYENIFTHIVKPGDSLWIIAKRYGTTTKKIRELNSLSNSNLHIRQVLKIPGSKKRPAQSGLRTYNVKRGDSPFKIAKRYNMSLKSFLNVNGLTPRSKIYPKQKLYIK
jgi:membrane-bound lytic murein transglycosylase D|tara:strand:+ start:1290 stop:3122 length:1833 start_codon:yes stop_codon:yes gene_type:complete